MFITFVTNFKILISSSLSNHNKLLNVTDEKLNSTLLHMGISRLLMKSISTQFKKIINNL